MSNNQPIINLPFTPNGYSLVMAALDELPSKTSRGLMNELEMIAKPQIEAINAEINKQKEMQNQVEPEEADETVEEGE